MIVDRTEKVHSTGNLDYTNKTTVRFSLPKNTYSPEQSKEIVAWAYWIGVGNESEIAWTKNVKSRIRHCSHIRGRTFGRNSYWRYL